MCSYSNISQSYSQNNLSDKVVEKIRTRLFSITLFPKILPFFENVEKCGRTGQTTYDYNTAHALYLMDK
jgi:hypothetical protein